jgi:Beta-propeller repeat.
MGKLFYIIIISFVYLTINSCGEIERSTELSDSSYSEQISSSAYDILTANMLASSEIIFKSEQTMIEKGKKTNPDNQKVFLFRKSSYGSKDWIINLDISVDKSGISMTFDSLENVYVTGYVCNVCEENKDSQDFTVFLVKYNRSGKREWTKKLGKSKVEYGARLNVDSSDNIYVTGFSNDLEDPNTLLEKYNTSGISVWTKKLGSTLNDYTWDVTVDSENNIYLTGLSDNIFLQNINWQNDVILKKFSTDGIKL